MTTFSTRALADKIMGEDEVAANPKAATRELRKFLRDELGEGKAVVGKGGRYALDLKAAEVRAMTKKFNAWKIQQEEEKAARAALRAEQANNRTAPAIEDESVLEDEAPEADESLEGPSDEEIAAMLSDDDNEV